MEQKRNGNRRLPKKSCDHASRFVGDTTACRPKRQPPTTFRRDSRPTDACCRRGGRLSGALKIQKFSTARHPPSAPCQRRDTPFVRLCFMDKTRAEQRRRDVMTVAAAAALSSTRAVPTTRRRTRSRVGNISKRFLPRFSRVRQFVRRVLDRCYYTTEYRPSFLNHRVAMNLF